MHYGHPMPLSGLREVRSRAFQEPFGTIPEARLDGRADLLDLPGVLFCLHLFPACMSPQEQRFDGPFGLVASPGMIPPTRRHGTAPPAVRLSPVPPPPT